MKIYSLRSAAMLNEEHLAFRVGCTDMGAINISLFTLFCVAPNSYNNCLKFTNLSTTELYLLLTILTLILLQLASRI